MKADRRHELKENVLAKDLSLAGEFIRKNLNWIAGVAAVILLLGAVAYYAVNRARAAKQQEWTQYYQLVAVGADTPEQRREQLLNLAQTTSQEPLAAWAYLQAGNLGYNELMLKWKTLDAASQQSLAEQIRGCFEPVVTRYSGQVEPAALARIGLGLLAETQQQLDVARQEYQAAAELAGDRAPLVGETAKAHLKRLESLQVPVVLTPGTPPPTATMPADTGTLPNELPPIVPDEDPAATRPE